MVVGPFQKLLAPIHRKGTTQGVLVAGRDQQHFGSLGPGRQLGGDQPVLIDRQRDDAGAMAQLQRAIGQAVGDIGGPFAVAHGDMCGLAIARGKGIEMGLDRIEQQLVVLDPVAEIGQHHAELVAAMDIAGDDAEFLQRHQETMDGRHGPADGACHLACRHVAARSGQGIEDLESLGDGIVLRRRHQTLNSTIAAPAP